MTDLILGQVQVEVSPFDQIRHIDEQGKEYWMARELMVILGYPRWADFKDVIDRAQAACRNSRNPVREHFSGTTLKNSGPGRTKDDFILTRYAGYLIAQNGDPRKPQVALAQTYFALSTWEFESIKAGTLESSPNPKNEALEDMAFLQEIGKLLEWAGIDPLLIAGHVMSQCATRHPALADRFEGMKRLIPRQESMQLESMLLTPTEVGQKLDPVVSPRQVNKILLELGLQEKTGEKNPPYKLTDKGQVYGKIILNQGSHSAKTVQQVRWKESVIDLIDRYLETVEGLRSNHRNKTQHWRQH